MIVKIKTYKKPAFGKLLSYMMSESERLFDENGKSFLITHNVSGSDIDSWVKQFKENEGFRKHKRKNSVYLNHEIISWHKDDVSKISLEKMMDMIHEYIQLRNPNGMYVAVPHFDREHYHVHICSSAIEYHSGKSMRMSRQEFSDLKKGIQKYQVEKFPELSRSIAEHGKKQRSISDKEHQHKKRTGKETDKATIEEIVGECFASAKTVESFLERVKSAGVEVYIRGGKPYGVIYGKRKYRFKRLGIDLGKFKGKEIERDDDLQNLRKKNRERKARRSR